MVKEYPVFKAAAVQAGSVFKDKPFYFDSKATLEKAIDSIMEAAENKVKLIVFPEAFLPGYPYWSLDFKKVAEWHISWREYLRHSVEVPSEETELICKAAKEADAYVVIGINERDKIYEGRMYNSILYIDPKGKILGTHRKINITSHELFFHTRGDGGDNLKVFDTEIGKISGLICGEHYQPTLKQYLIIQGAQVNCSLWPGTMKKITEVMTQAFCISGRLFAVVASCYIPEDQRPKDFYENNSFAGLIGGSCIINPRGEVVAGPVFDKEAIVYYDIDLGQIPLAESSVNLRGIYSRWDILSLNVRQKQYEPFYPLEAAEALMASAPPAASLDQVAELKTKITELEKQLQSIEKTRITEKENKV
jgi:predicted amidohydrolase